MGIQEQTGKELGGKQNSLFPCFGFKKIPVSSILIVSNEEMRPIFYYYYFVFNVLEFLFYKYKRSFFSLMISRFSFFNRGGLSSLKRESSLFINCNTMIIIIVTIITISRNTQ